MKHRPLGASGISASVIGFGGWAAGGWMWGGQDEKAAIEAVRAGVDAGITLIDTAPVYGFGRGEEVVGRAIRGIREKVVLATKCGLTWTEKSAHFHFAADKKSINPKGDIQVYRLLTLAAIRRDLEGSLRRLGTDHVDLYQTHWQDPGTPIEETMGCLMELKREGKIRAIGASNASVADMDRYRSVGPLDADQERYSLLDRQLEAEQLPYCRRSNVAVLAYSPLCHGLLAGRITEATVFPEGDLRRFRPQFKPEALRQTQELRDRIRERAERRGVTPAQWAVAWTLAQPGLTHALVGARDAKQARENAAAGDLELTAGEATF